MKVSESKPMPMKEALMLHAWAAKAWRRVDPKLFITTLLHSLVKELTPYVTIWLSAQFINELAGRRDAAVLGHWVILTLGITAGLNLLTALMQRWREAAHSLDFYQQMRMEVEKLLSMDYAAVDSPQMEAMRWAMQKHLMGNCYGVIKINQEFLEGLVGGIASIGGADGQPVFQQSSRNGAGHLAQLPDDIGGHDGASSAGRDAFAGA